MGRMLNGLAKMGSPMYAWIIVAILLVSMSTVEYFLGSVDAINTMDSGKATWEYLSSRLKEDFWSQILAENEEVIPSGITAVSTRVNPDIYKIFCFKCNKRAHIYRYCKSEARSNVNYVNEEDECPKVRPHLSRNSNHDETFILYSGCTYANHNKWYHGCLVFVEWFSCQTTNGVCAPILRRNQQNSFGCEYLAS